ncbi:MAG: flavin reductase family protein [Candidatus Methanofastidiosia archaeon]
MQKKTLGSKPFVYPMPASIVGADVDKKPNFMTIAYCGVVNNGPAMVAIGSSPKHHTMNGIKENNTFSVNIPSEDLVEKTDFIGTYSGKNIDKSEVFEVFYGKLKTAPLIKECPINMECKVVKIMDLGGSDTIVIGEVIESYCAKEHMTNGQPDITKFKPLLYTTGDKKYWGIGKFCGDAWNIGSNYKIKEG